MNELHAWYAARSAGFGEEARTLQRTYERLSLVRLAVFLVGVLLIVLAWTNGTWMAGVAATTLFIAFFGLFIRRHQQVLKRQQHLERKQQINDRERQAQEGILDAFPDGAAYLDPDHPYALDLDVFGPFSLFQYINRGSTVLGQSRLAEYLQAAGTLEEIRARQEASEELSARIDWRQDLQALGMEVADSPRHVDLLRRWLYLDNLVLGNPFLQASLWVSPFLAVLALGAWIFFLPWYLAILFILPAGLVLRRTLDQVNKLHIYTAEAGEMLQIYGRLIGHIEREKFESPLLREISASFQSERYPASRSIRRLSYLISQLNVRYNFFAVFLNLGGLWDLQWIYQLERWRARERTRLLQWFDALAELEALVSLATVRFNHPDWPFPVVQAAGPLTAIAMGHPLIREDLRVPNDLEMPTKGHIKLITGSNMAGKSTFLRTAGVNIVLALCGAPVCAQRLETPLLQVYTSMRTKDALHENTSSFLAELKRLKVIIDAVKAEAHIFFLLDEILKGTNSRDRHQGAKALIEQLIRYGGGGLVATHDLELASLEASSKGAVENLCMEVAIQEGALAFDYRIKKGVSQSFNASILMRQMGIEIEE